MRRDEKTIRGWLSCRTEFIMLLAGALLSTGCQSGDIFYRSQARGSQPVAIDDTRLASYQPSTALVDVPASAPADVREAPVGQPTMRPTTRATYSAPGSGVRNIDFLRTAVVASTMSEVAGPGREASESALARDTGTFAGIGGAPSLSAPTSPTLDAVVGAPGLQRGIAIGFGPLPPSNLFSREIIPLSGPMGRCRDLTRGGFFGSVDACERHFHR